MNTVFTRLWTRSFIIVIKWDTSARCQECDNSLGTQLMIKISEIMPWEFSLRNISPTFMAKIETITNSWWGIISVDETTSIRILILNRHISSIPQLANNEEFQMRSVWTNLFQLNEWSWNWRFEQYKPASRHEVWSSRLLQLVPAGAQDPFWLLQSKLKNKMKTFFMKTMANKSS